MNGIILYYILVIHISCIIAQIDLSKRYVITDEQTMKPCYSNAFTNLSGLNVFNLTNMDPATTSINSFTMAAWYSFKGYKSSPHSILRVSHSSEGQIYMFSFNPSNSQFSHSLKTTPPYICQGTSILHQWIYLKVKVSLRTSSTQDQVDFEYQLKSSASMTGCTSPFYHNFPTGSTATIATFDRDQISFNFGDTSVNSSISSSCARVRNMVIYLGNLPESDSVGTIYHKKYSIFAERRSHYDFFYTKKNTNKLLSFNSYFRYFTSDLLNLASDGSVQILKSSQTFKLDRMFSLNEHGYIIYFEFKVSSNADIFFKVSSSSSSSGGDIFATLYSNSLNELRYTLGSSDGLIGMLDPTTPDKWHSVALICDSYLSSEFAFLVNFNGILTPYSNPTVSNFYHSSFVEFGSQFKTIEISNIRIFEGSFVAQSNTCLVETVGRTKNECLFCKAPYVLSYQDGGTCVNPIGSTYTLSRLPLRVADWNRNECDSGMMHMKQTTDCFCQYSQYAVGSTCYDCPRYCKGCSSAISCDQRDLNRNLNDGTCNSNLFDDGYNCLDRLFSIPNRKNTYILIQQSGVFYKVLTKYEIAPEGGMNPYFLVGQFGSITKSGVYSDSIFTFTNNGIEIITVLILRENPSDLQAFRFCYLNQSFDVQLNKLLIVSFGIWFSHNKLVIVTQTNGIFSHEIIQMVFIPATDTQYINPVICVGQCTTSNTFAITPNPYISSNSADFLRFYPGMTDPSDRIQDLKDLICTKSTFLGDYIFQWGTVDHIPPSLLKVYTLTSPLNGYKLDIDPTKAITHLYKGIAWTKADANPFTNISSSLDLSISLNIFVEQLQDEYVFLMYTIQTTLKVQYSLLPEPSNNYAILRICFSFSCFLYKSCRIYFNEPSFLAIILRPAQFNSSNSRIIEAEVVCNEQRMRYEYPQADYPQADYPQAEYIFHTTFSSIKFIKSPNDSLVFLNNIRFLGGSDFYFDYTLDDPCFLYFNSLDMLCIKPKKGYALFHYKPIKESECNSSLASQQTVVIVNPYTQECFDTKVYMPFCKIINPYSYERCAECLDPNADSEKSCECKDGYFFSSVTGLCETCSEQCKICSGSKDNCIECVNTNANPAPNCQCSEPNQFFQFDFSCASCESKCDSCKQSSSNCLTCSKNRVNPPTCTCDPTIFDPIKSNDINCFSQLCDAKCTSCISDSSNCFQCSGNRVNPPLCECPLGFVESLISPNCICPQDSFQADQKTCSTCPTHTYYNKPENTCKTCNTNCLDCKDQNFLCTSCLTGEMYLEDSACLCLENGMPVIHSNASDNSFTCAKTYLNILTMEAQFSSKASELIFTFDEESIDSFSLLSQREINSVLLLYIPNVPTSAYSIHSLEIIQNQLIVQLEFKSSFKANQGIVQFLVTRIFKNSETQSVLDPKYLDAIFEFSIGPLILSDAVRQQSDTQVLSNLAQSMKDGGDLLYILQQLQICLYVLNTLQPSSIFLLINVAVPSNLYSLLQVTGLLVFPNVTNYGTINQVSRINVFFGGYPFEKHLDFTVNSSFVFRQLGFSSSVVLSIHLTVVLYFFWSIAYFLFKLKINLTLNRQKISQTEIEKQIASDTKKLEFLWARIVSGNEAGVLLLISSVINQFQNSEESYFMNRVSVYACCLLTIAFIYFVRINYLMLFKKWPTQSVESIQKLSENLFVDSIIKQKDQVEIDKDNGFDRKDVRFAYVVDKNDSKTINPPSLEKLNLNNIKNSLAIRQYYFVQLIKKLVLAVSVVVLEDFPGFLCVLAILVMAISLISSVYVRPYKFVISNIAKIIGETCLLLVWIVYFFVFIPMNSQFSESISISNEDIDTFSRYGLVSMICLFGLNAIYFFEFLAIQVIFRIIDLIKSRKSKSKATNS